MRLLLEFYIIYQNDQKKIKISTATSVRVDARIDIFCHLSLYCKTDAFHTISYKKKKSSGY